MLQSIVTIIYGKFTADVMFVSLIIHREHLKVLVKDVNQQKKVLKEKGIHVDGKHYDVEFIGKICYVMTFCHLECFVSICFCFGSVAEKSAGKILGICQPQIYFTGKTDVISLLLMPFGLEFSYFEILT